MFKNLHKSWLINLFDMRLVESCLRDYWKASRYLHLGTLRRNPILSLTTFCLKVVSERIRSLSVRSKIFEKLLNNRLVKHFEKIDFLFDFQYDS